MQQYLGNPLKKIIVERMHFYSEERYTIALYSIQIHQDRKIFSLYGGIYHYIEG